MLLPLLATKLYIPSHPYRLVSRPRLIEQLNEGLQRKLILVSAPAGFGKTTLLSEWLSNCQRPVAWLSLDNGDSDPARFLTYLVTAMQKIAPEIGEGVLGALQSPHLPPIASILAVLLNSISTISDDFVLVLDDYHLIDDPSIDQALTFLLEHLPSQMHLVIATREHPDLPLSRLRAKGHLAEVNAVDLRFSAAEASEFLNQVMELNLETEVVEALESRTEGWIAGLQLAALSMRGQKDIARFIQSFTGSHHFVLDYLVEEVLHQQTEGVQIFLLRTSILDRLCGSLCDAILVRPNGSSQETLEYLERANLFIIPLDNERHWYRYHHIFAEFLRQRLSQSAGGSADNVAELNRLASIWYENHELEVEAFQHAAAANDIERAERLIDGKRMKLHLRSVVVAILNWLGSLQSSVLDGRPSLWVKFATLALIAGQTTGVQERLQAAETALQIIEPDDRIRDLIGQIAAARATLALTQYQPEMMIFQAQRALEYLYTNNLPFRFTAVWTLASAYRLQGDRTAAQQAYTEALSISQASDDMLSTILATSDLGLVQESENLLYLAAETYRRARILLGDYPHPNACEVHLGLARIYYEWNDLDSADQHGQQSLQLAQQYDHVIDRFLISQVFLARLKLAQGNVAGASALLAQADLSARQHSFMQRMPEIAEAQVLTLLRQGDLAAAGRLAETHNLPISRARVLLAQGNFADALAVLESLRKQIEIKGWVDERLRVLALQVVALRLHGDTDRAMPLLDQVLALAEPSGCIRLFIDEGLPMKHLLQEAVSRGTWPDYARRLIAAFSPIRAKRTAQTAIMETLSERELEVLQYIAEGLTDREIANRLYLSLHTVKVHARNIYGKLGVGHRTQAVARARELSILPRS